SPSSSKVRVSDKNNKSFTSMSNDHLRSEIARRAMAVVEAYEELGNACRKAEYAVSQLKVSSNTTTSGINDDTMVASLLMSLTNASWERNTNSVEIDKTNNDSSIITNSPTSSNPGAVMGSFDGYSLDDDDEIYDQKHDSSSEQDLGDDINMIDNTSYDNKSSPINDSNSESTRKRSSSNRNRTRRKPSASRVSSSSSPYSTQFTPEEILFLDEFNKLYEKRVQLGPTRQSDIASEIRQFANNAIAFGQPAVSGLVRKTKVPKEQRAVNALKAWIESGKKRLGVV
ncbi:10435_t:CDS:2, partial [Dentiscutata heterogama]